MKKTADFLRACGTFYIATAEGDQPRVRPFGALDEFEGRLYLVTNNKKPVFAQLTANPKIEICAMDKDMRWIRVTATAVTDPRKEAKEHMLAANPGLARMYSADDGVMEVFFLKDASVTLSSFTAPPESWSF
ncbi:MAG: pyridoxamine 5'-phosphate oxidase family protein [Clostridia bacterium]|nr:pyridoxamine 5'-phosphate oxidase family protein [Clostridia bacterium]